MPPRTTRLPRRAVGVGDGVGTRGGLRVYADADEVRDIALAFEVDGVEPVVAEGQLHVVGRVRSERRDPEGLDVRRVFVRGGDEVDVKGPRHSACRIPPGKGSANVRMAAPDVFARLGGDLRKPADSVHSVRSAGVSTSKAPSGQATSMASMLRRTARAPSRPRSARRRGKRARGKRAGTPTTPW